jgi:hypothetical protein
VLVLRELREELGGDELGAVVGRGDRRRGLGEEGVEVAAPVAALEISARECAGATGRRERPLEDFDFAEVISGDVEEAGLVGEDFGDGAVAGFSEQGVGGLDEVFVGLAGRAGPGDPLAGESGRRVADSQKDVGGQVFACVRLDGAAAEAAKRDEDEAAAVVGGEAEGGATFEAGELGATVIAGKAVRSPWRGRRKRRRARA